MPVLDRYGRKKVMTASIGVLAMATLLCSGAPSADIREITDIRGEIPEDDFGLPVTERDYHEIDGIMKKYDFLKLPELSMLAGLERDTGISAAQIKTNDKAVLNMLWKEGFSFLPGRNENQKEGESLEDAVIRELKPSCFSDFGL